MEKARGKIALQREKKDQGKKQGEEKREMEIAKMITQWSLRLHDTGNITTTKKLTSKQSEVVKAAKPEILTELKRQHAEREAHAAAAKAEHLRQVEDYHRNADLRSYLVKREDEGGRETWSFQTLVLLDDKIFKPEYGLVNYIDLPYLTPTMTTAKTNDVKALGFTGLAWEVTARQKEQIFAEQESAKKEAEKEAARVAQEKMQKNIDREAERKVKFKEARNTGKPVELERAMVDCDGSVGECSTDIVYRYAMPDGSVQTKRIHTH